MSRPKKKVPPSALEIILESMSLLGFLILLGLVIYYYPQLPESIPTHFNVSGKPDAWGNKSNIILLVVIAAVLYSGLSILNRFPHVFSYPVVINEKNVVRQYRMARTLLSFLKTSTLLIFIFILYSNIRIAEGFVIQFETGYMILLVSGLLILPVIIYILYSIRN